MRMKEKLIQYFKDKKADLPPLAGLDRLDAIRLFEEKGFPHARLEKWQKSVVRKFIDKNEYVPVDPGLSKRSDFVVTEDENTIYISVDTAYDFSNSFWRHHSGAWIGSLKSGAEIFPALFEKHFNRYAKQDLNGLTALNNALTDQGLFMYFPKASRLDKSIYLLLERRNNNGFELMRNLIIVEDLADVSLIQSDLTDIDQSGFMNSVTEIYVGNGSRLMYCKEQDQGLGTAAVNNIFINQERDSESTVLNASICGGMIRNEVHVRLNDEGSTSNVYGVYLPGTGEQVDNQVFIDHAYPNCQSNELFKGVLKGEGTSVFNGHILVRQDAQKTNAYQKNRNILLSDSANAYAKPFLEIYADDVKCSHGATIGQLDENALFYLQSRGLSEAKAKEFLVKAFLGEILDICTHDGFRLKLEDKIEQKLHQ